jgi:hypothetical protein
MLGWNWMRIVYKRVNIIQRWPKGERLRVQKAETTIVMTMMTIKKNAYLAGSEDEEGQNLLCQCKGIFHI